VFWGFLHGIALVIHRAWSQLGFKIWTWLAWLITFNFVNIAWVFFRAKEWDDAVKVLSGMVGLSSITVANKFKKYLDSYDWITFGQVTQHIGAGSKILTWVIVGFIIVLLLKNSNSYLKVKMNIWLIIISSILFSYSVFLSLVSSSQVFLYFNF